MRSWVFSRDAHLFAIEEKALTFPVSMISMFQILDTDHQCSHRSCVFLSISVNMRSPVGPFCSSPVLSWKATVATASEG
jgi:hypothetical protein